MNFHWWICTRFILREDQGPSRIEHLFLGYLDKWPRKWPGIGRALANPVPISQSGANRSIWCQSANPVPIGQSDLPGLAWIGRLENSVVNND